MSNTEVMKQSAVKLAGKHPKNKIHRTAGDIAFDVSCTSSLWLSQFCAFPILLPVY